jgi:hypothetical protein
MFMRASGQSFIPPEYLSGEIWGKESVVGRRITLFCQQNIALACIKVKEIVSLVSNRRCAHQNGIAINRQTYTVSVLCKHNSCGLAVLTKLHRQLTKDLPLRTQPTAMVSVPGNEAGSLTLTHRAFQGSSGRQRVTPDFGMWAASCCVEKSCLADKNGIFIRWGGRVLHESPTAKCVDSEAGCARWEIARTISGTRLLGRSVDVDVDVGDLVPSSQDVPEILLLPVGLIQPKRGRQFDKIVPTTGFRLRLDTDALLLVSTLVLEIHVLPKHQNGHDPK